MMAARRDGDDVRRHDELRGLAVEERCAGMCDVSSGLRADSARIMRAQHIHLKDGKGWPNMLMWLKDETSPPQYERTNRCGEQLSQALFESLRPLSSLSTINPVTISHKK